MLDITIPDGRQFVLEGWRYICDGRMALSIETGEPDEDGDAEEAMRKYVPGVMLPARDNADMEPWPADPQKVEKEGDCWTCGGSGYVDRDVCPTCEGDGVHECDCGDEHNCGRCDGAGEMGGTVCKECHGKKRIHRPDYIVMPNGASIRWDFARKIDSLPNVRWRRKREKEDSAILFAFDGGIGAVMPLKI
jgi:hypothetical protein